MLKTGNLLSGLPEGRAKEEIFETLEIAPGMRIERIVSTGQVTADDDWYDQDEDEWVMVLAGSARLLIAGEDKERQLGAGDWIHLPAHCRHRVTWTQEDPPTVWLAVHYEASE
ncbi:cupin domain-containing protein [Hoeflea sp.]|uniref:cupin domain-containing protein n=1 Tax=Hoeflea sp. TaxID=1940281 RepID=UPI003B02DD3E